MRLPRLFDGLAFRIGLLLTVALFPIGLIAVSLTSDIASSADQREHGILMSRTTEAAAGEESLMVGARTIVTGLVKALPDLLEDPETCNAVFASFAAAESSFSFAGYIDETGWLICGSDLRQPDLTATESVRIMSAEPAPRIDVRARAAIAGRPVIVVQEPYTDETGAYRGFVSLSLPATTGAYQLPASQDGRNLTFLTFNYEGTVMASNTDPAEVAKVLPEGSSLAGFVGSPRRSFEAKSVGGQERIYAVVPIFPGQLYALGSWEAISPLAQSEAVSPLLFVALMWLVSLGVAYLAVHRLALTNIADLQQRMSLFTATRRVSRSEPEDPGTPFEFREINRTWEDLAETVVREEAELENIIHSRTVLLKEVHHRVKNNLQLISSIVSMKLRKAATPEARNALKEVQMRVSSISIVHQALYDTTARTLVDAGELLHGIVAKSAEAAQMPAGRVRVTTSWDKVALYPDQAVPLSLLVSEAVTNAMKYAVAPEGGPAWMTVHLRRVSDSAAELIIENSNSDVPDLTRPPRGTGLGLNLMRAFALQMRGTVEIRKDLPDRFRVRVAFQVSAFDGTPMEGSLADLPDPTPARPAAEASSKPAQGAGVPPAAGDSALQNVP